MVKSDKTRRTEGSCGPRTKLFTAAEPDDSGLDPEPARDPADELPPDDLDNYPPEDEAEHASAAVFRRRPEKTAR